MVNGPIRHSESGTKDAVYQVLRQELLSGQWHAGDRFETLKALSERFSTSAKPVRNAIAMLEEEGLLVRKQGSGTFVASVVPDIRMQDAVVIVTEPNGHLYGNIAMLACNQIQQHSLWTFVLSTADQGLPEKLESAGRSHAAAIVVAAGIEFPWDLLERPPVSHTPVVCMIENSENNGRYHQVLSDGALAGREMAAHLIAENHRRVVIAAPEKMLALAQSGAINGTHYSRTLFRGLRDAEVQLDFLPMSPAPAPDFPLEFDLPRLRDLLQSDPRPTALAGLYDYATWSVARTLLKVDSDLLSGLYLAGYANTPWSQALFPPFTTVDLELEKIAEATAKVILDIRHGFAARRREVTIPPRLITR